MAPIDQDQFTSWGLGVLKMAEPSEVPLKFEDFNDPAFDGFVEETMNEFLTPGMAVLVLHGDKTAAKGYGYSDLANKTPVTPSTLFFAGSTTKSFTAALAAHLIESLPALSLNWDTPLAKLIREDFVLDQSSPEGQWATNHVTIVDALAHRSGSPRHDLTWINGDPSNREIVRSTRHVSRLGLFHLDSCALRALNLSLPHQLPLHNEIRAEWEYCNIMYTAVSLATETALNRPFKELLKGLIFDPLGMSTTTYALTDAMEIAEKCADIHMARGYLWDSDVQEYELVPFESIPPSKGSGGIISNVLDYNRWMRHLLRPSELNGALSKDAVKAMRTPRTVVQPDARKPYVGPQAYCLGLYSQVYRGREILQHSGATAGYMASMLMVPPTTAEVNEGKEDGSWAVIVMQNTYSLAQDVVVWHLLDKFLGTPEEERFDMAQAARDAQVKSLDDMKPEKVLERLFGAAQRPNGLGPTLPLEQYEGVYEHPAYHKFKLSLSPPSDSGRIGVSRTKEQDKTESRQETIARVTTSRQLFLRSGSTRAYFDISATLYHVSGEWWWSSYRMGPSSWITDAALKVQFVIGPSGNVDGMRYQAEAAMPDHLAFFRKIE